jgi:hypothetical protein
MGLRVLGVLYPLILRLIGNTQMYHCARLLKASTTPIMPANDSSMPITSSNMRLFPL